MDFEISEEQKMLQTAMREFVEKECLPVEQEMLRTDPDWVELPPEVFQDLRNKIKKLGFWAFDVPPEYGGQGLDTVTSCIITEEEHKTTVGSAHYTPFWRWMGFNALYRGTDYQKENYLYPVLRGEKRGAIANTEPGAGSDAANIQTAAVRDGDDWIINGRKTFITMADTSDFLYLNTVTDKSKGRDGFTVFLVDKGTPGFTEERAIHTIRPIHSWELSFEDCRVPDRQRLEGSGWSIMQEGLGHGRMMYAQRCVGNAVRSLDIALDYVPTRITFGQPLSSRQAIQWMLADSAIEIHLTRLMVLEGAWKVDQGEDVRQVAAMVKLYATEMAFRVLDRCIQCIGGIGLTKDLPLERWFREIRVLRITEGASEVQRMVIARNLLRDRGR